MVARKENEVMATKMRKSKKRNCIKLVVKEEKEVMATKMVLCQDLAQNKMRSSAS